MGTEDQHFIEGPGRCFRAAYFLARRGADPTILARAVIKGLRRDLREHGGPTALFGLAHSCGVVADDLRLCLPLTVPRDDLERQLASHRHPESPSSHWDVQTVRREWNRLHRLGGQLRTIEDLLLDWCLEKRNSLFFGRIEDRLEGLSPGERLDLSERTRNEISRRLRMEDRDVIASLSRDPSGEKVRIRVPSRKEKTADLLHLPITSIVGERSR